MRGRVLRPGQRPEDLVYDGDDHPLALHVIVEIGGEVCGIATVTPEPPPPQNRDEIPPEAYASGASFRLRGMATDPATQKRGVGRAALERCFVHVRQSGASFIWCNARIGALDFYDRMGFVAVGDQFDIAGIGPHYVMWRSVDVDDPSKR